MFFYLSKILGALVVPSNLIVLVGLVGLVLWPAGFAKAGRRLVAASFLFIVLIGVTPVGTALVRFLEDRFPPWQSGGQPAGIVVLGGSINPEISQARGSPALNDSAERLLAVGDLARRYPAARIIFTGGNNAVFPGAPPEADFVLPILDSLGVARARVTLERHSRTTAENARDTFALIAPKPGERWLLVTSAIHMPRAVGAFRQAGFSVEAYPVDWRTMGRAEDYLPTFFLLDGLARFDAAAHEWEGLLAYWLVGRSSAFLPAP